MTRQKRFIKAFFKEKPIALLLSLRDGPKYATVISKRIDCTYSHTIKILNEFKALGIVDFEKRGRIKMVYLTKEGEELLHAIEEILKKF
ncbi:MAG: winged helix-turn-helix transcriptional regulator [Candidatus Aenigmarchaeota archaeon]|nr:winged helix-turn-helix transcriptional regulator [Candidatus Aenigmarchaeota archaeon]